MDDGSNACVFLLAVQVFFFSGSGEKDDGEIDLMAGARSCTVKYVIYINIFHVSASSARRHEEGFTHVYYLQALFVPFT